MKTTITLDWDTADLLQRLAAHTNLTINTIINRLLSGHLSEMYELEAFLDKSPTGSDSPHEQASNLLLSYGPESISEGLARIVPATYETLEARFKREMLNTIGVITRVLE